MIITSADFDQNTKSAKTPRLKIPNSAPDEAGEAAGDREGGELVGAHIDADKGGALRVFADRRQYPAERRAGQPAQRRDAQRHQHQRQQVEQFADAEAVEAGQRSRSSRGRGTARRAGPGRRRSRSFHLKQIAQTICAKARVSIAK